MSNENKQTKVFIIKDGNDIVGYLNINARLNAARFAAVEQGLLERLNDGSVQPKILANKVGDTYLAFMFNNSAVAWFRAADEEDTPEAVYEDLLAGSYEYASYVKSDINADLEGF